MCLEHTFNCILGSQLRRGWRERTRKDKDRNHPKLHRKRITSTNQGQKTLKCGCTPLLKAQWHAKALCLPHAPAITVSLMIQEQKDGVQQWESDALERCLLGLDRADTRSGAKVLLNPFPICPIVYPFKFSQLLLLSSWTDATFYRLLRTTLSVLYCPVRSPCSSALIALGQPQKCAL